MANYFASSRTNHFAVKDRDAFNAAMEPFEVNVQTHEDLVTIISTDPDNGAWPRYDHETDEDIDFPGLVAEHLADGHVAVFMEVGTEKLRYITGVGMAVNNRGEFVSVDLEDMIMRQARHLGPHVTRPASPGF